MLGIVVAVADRGPTLPMPQSLGVWHKRLLLHDFERSALIVARRCA
jgi:hypothetical protein